MNFASLKPTLPRLQRSAVALALAAFGVSASALPVFTLDGDGAATAAAPVRADNILISDFARVLINGTSFSESGYLSVTDLQLGGVNVQNSGLGSAYNMYVEFTGNGTLSSATANPNAVPTFGTFQNLTFNLYGYGGTVATFGVGPDGATVNGVTPGIAVGVTGEVLLASGSLAPGSISSVSTVPGPGAGFSPSASTLLTFNLTDAGRTRFTAPSPFYEMAFASFTNSPSQVTMFSGGFTIQQGGGSINFTAAPIPEPETYALMLAGLAAVGFVARRRRPQA